MARTNRNVTQKELEEALEKALTQTKAAKILGVTQSYVSQLMKHFEIDASMVGETPRDEKLEAPSYTYNQVKALTKGLMEVNSPTVGYDQVSIKLDTKYNILIVPLADWHIGARWVYYDRLEKDLEFIRDTANVFCGLNGDYCDNYEVSPYRQGRHEQQLSVAQQKAVCETYLKEIKGKVLWFLNGCHDEWSYINDGFDLAQYLAHKDQHGYYMGHNGVVNLKIGKVSYKLYTTHKAIGSTKRNPGNGLKEVLREHGEYDIGISAHRHVPHTEQFINKKLERYIVTCGPYKGQDRNGSQAGYAPTKLDIPGILLSPKERTIITNIDYRKLVQYL